jgi:hypothetical protein
MFMWAMAEPAANMAIMAVLNCMLLDVLQCRVVRLYWYDAD